MGHQWWSDKQADEPSAKITPVFEGISDGTLRLPVSDGWCEDLDNLSVVPLGKIGWGQSCRHEIFCYAPLPDAAGLYSMLQAWLVEVDAFKEPACFLNQGYLLAEFKKIASGNSYLLGRVPDAVRDLLCAELDRQQVAFSVLEHSNSPETRLWVRLNQIELLCEKAWAEIQQDGPGENSLVFET